MVGGDVGDREGEVCGAGGATFERDALRLGADVLDEFEVVTAHARVDPGSASWATRIAASR